MENNISNNNYDDHGKLVCDLMTEIGKVYWEKMYNYYIENSIDIQDVNCFILNSDKIMIYFSKKFVAIEYYGDPFKKELKQKFVQNVFISDYSKEDINNREFIEKIIGFDFDGTSGITLPLPHGIHEDLIIPTMKGSEKLIDLNWNFSAQNSIVAFNLNGIDLVEHSFYRFINCFFFDSNDGDLKTRRVQWIDFIPLEYDDTKDGDHDYFNIKLGYYLNLWKLDMFYKYPKPSDFKYKRLPQVNRFIELFGDSKSKEPDITSFLEKNENKFILINAFTGVEVHGQVKCEWQSEMKKSIKPDFFIKRSNGYADIVEFKLPRVKNNTVVGRENREQFSFEISSYIAQTRVYKTYFEDPNNRQWFEDEYGYKVRYPKRYLVVGRRSDFESEVWIEIKEEFKDLEIISYDDLVDTVVAQFYISE